MTHLVIAEQVEGEHYRGGLLHCLQAVMESKNAGNQGEVHLLLVGHHADESAKQAANIAGVDKILLIDEAGFANVMAEAIAPIIVEMAANYSHVWALADTFGKNIMPRVAAMLDIQQISDITAICGQHQYERPIYAGNALSVVESNQGKDMITVRATAFEAVESTGGNAVIEAVNASSAQDQSSFVGAELSQSERPELTSAKIVISGGRGMQDGKNFVMLDEIADKLGAAVGASRAAVDAGFVPNDYQVGQTGKVVAPELYVAVGISGAIQHLAGMKDSKTIVAINKDEDAPIFQVADYGLVADLFDALPELNKALE